MRHYETRFEVFVKVSAGAEGPARDELSLGLTNTLSWPLRGGLEYFERGVEEARLSGCGRAGVSATEHMPGRSRGGRPLRIALACRPVAPRAG
jgi:hypothetical protein